MEDIRWIPLSALQHMLFCPRQCALIHNEQQWQDNRYTAEGRVLHERADTPGHERRRGVYTVRALAIANRGLHINGIADVVEFGDHKDQSNVRPIEYKRGRPKVHRADEVQLCAQALCLEDMLDITITEGVLFYGKTKRRKAVAFDNELRRLTLQVVKEVREQFDSGDTPSAHYDAKRCDHCSLIDLCPPRAFGKQRSARKWLSSQFSD